MSSSQRRVKNRYDFRLKLMALFTWLRRRALDILRKRRAIASDTETWCDLYTAPLTLPVSDSAKLIAAAQRIAA